MASIDRKKKSQQNKLLYIFLTAFFVTLVTLIYLATAFTPVIDVDVPAPTEEETYVLEEPRQDVDSRLKAIQEEDLSPDGAVSKEPISEIAEQLKKMKEEALAKQAAEEIELVDDAVTELKTEGKKESAAKSIEPMKKPLLADPTFKNKTTQESVPTKMAKIYVGSYTTFEHAIQTQDALIKASLATAPFVKNLGEYYVIQVGSFSNHQTAQNIAEQLIEAGYHARLVVE